MIGKKFGKLTVKEFNINTKLWICQCECGNLKEVSTRDLNSGNIKSCGNHKEIHLDGQIFGDLTVIGKAENSSLLVCRCSCGGTILTSGIKLINGEITHCKSTVHKEPKYNLEGLKFGKLTVIRFNSTTRLWECKCECGNTKEVKGSNLINKRVMSCGCLLNSPKLDLTGRIFGKLEVIKYIGKSNYECRCRYRNIP